MTERGNVCIISRIVSLEVQKRLFPAGVRSPQSHFLQRAPNGDICPGGHTSQYIEETYICGLAVSPCTTELQWTLNGGMQRTLLTDSQVCTLQVHERDVRSFSARPSLLLRRNRSAISLDYRRAFRPLNAARICVFQATKSVAVRHFSAALKSRVLLYSTQLRH